jgi:hypothetical protein
MAGTSGKTGGQRTNTTSASGRKGRSPTSTAHTGSRVEPSHVNEKLREIAVKTSKTSASARDRAPSAKKSAGAKERKGE